MNQNENDHGYKSLSHQRRTYSVDEYGGRHMGYNGPSKGGKFDMIKQSSEDDYVCAVLPRTNSRPSAKTCW